MKPNLHSVNPEQCGVNGFRPRLLNKRHNRNNDGEPRQDHRNIPVATAVLFQTPVLNFGITPNNMVEYPRSFRFMKEVPTSGRKCVVDGYPGSMWYWPVVRRAVVGKQLSLTKKEQRNEGEKIRCSLTQK
jgi:hypothetical protein